MNIYTWTNENDYMIVIAPTLDIAMDGIKSKCPDAHKLYNIMDYKVSKIPNVNKSNDWQPIVITNTIT
jgi:hypothetical protein